MSIYRRGSTWWFTITIKGRTHRGSCKTSDQSEAQEYHDRFRAELWRGRVIGEAKKRTIVEAIDRFLAEHEHKRSYRDDLRYAQWWKGQFESVGVKLLEEVNSDLVKDIRGDALEQNTRRGTKTTPATVNRRLAFLSAVIRCAALEWQWMTMAPKFRMLPGERQRNRYLSPKEVVRLVECLPRPYADMGLFAVSTGLRQHNVMKLRWSNLDMQRRIATFPDLVMKNGLPFSCSLNETATKVIQKWIGRHEEYVFVREDGESINGIPSKTWKVALQKAGLANVRWHDLRHTWASLLRQNGVNLSDLREMGGWETPQMVQRYAHLNVEHLASKAAVMDGLLTGQKSGQLHLAAG